MAHNAVDIRERTMQYAVRAMQLYRHLLRKRDAVGLVLGRQYFRSATSIGANLVEAQAGESRKDFIHKCAIAQKEARECKYWLELMLRAEVIAPRRLTALMDETNQIIAILTTIIVKSKRRTAC